MKLFAFLALLPLSALANPVAQSGWTDLLSNNSLDAWKSSKGDKISDAWSIKNGVLHLDKSDRKKGGNLLTKKPYFNFELKFDWKISPGGNSGVKYRTNKLLGYECQVIDDNSKAAGKTSHRAGCLYDILEASDKKVLKPVGEWNKARIVANGNHLEHWLNGVKIIDTKIGSDDWKARFAKSKYKKIPAFAENPGPLLLQDHGNDVWYRNILIKEL